MLLFPYFFTIYRTITGSFEADPHLILADVEHRDFDVVAYADGLADAPS